MTMKAQFCKKHGLTDYYARTKGSAYCRLCHSERENARWHKDNSTLTRRYGMTVEKYNALLEKQGHRCAICRGNKIDKGRKRRFCVDHDHTTGIIRGLLCNRCNRVLGMIQDSPVLLRALEHYVSLNGSEQVQTKV